MSLFARLMQQLQRTTTRRLQQVVWYAATALVVGLVLFAGYYTWDRYVHLGDKSPRQLNVEQLEQAVREDPQDPDARVALAESYLRSGMYQAALDQTDQVLEAHPEHAGALLVSGIVYLRLDQPEEAVTPLRGFIALRKDEPMAAVDTSLEAAYYYLGASFLRLGRPAEAIPALEAALTITPWDADALYQAGLAYQASGQPEAALERYQQAVRFVPDFTEVYRAMIESYAALGLVDHVGYARGMLAFSTQDYQTAELRLETAAQALPEFAPAHLGLGLTYEKLGDLEAAQEAIQHALELDPYDLGTQQALGRIQASLDGQG
jgi:tetratricopeptide (TPR) repeat protein